MPDNTEMSAPITLAEGYNPFSDENAPQVQQQVEVAPTANEQQIVDNSPNTSPDSIVSDNQQTQQADYSTFNPDSFIKERFGFDKEQCGSDKYKFSRIRHWELLF